MEELNIFLRKKLFSLHETDKIYVRHSIRIEEKIANKFKEFGAFHEKSNLGPWPWSVQRTLNSLSINRNTMFVLL